MKRLILFSAAVIGIIAGCSGPKKEADGGPSHSLSDTMMNMVAIDTAKLSPVENELKLTGSVRFDEEGIVKVYPMVSGLATEVKVACGDYVKKGQALAVILSSESANIRNDLLNAQSNLAIAKKDLQAAEDLYKSGISSEKEYLTAQSDYRKAESELTRVTDIVKINGNNATADYVITAPVSGYIVERLLNPAMQIRSDNGNNLFTISNLNHVWVVANVYETDIARVHKGDEVSVTTIAYPDSAFKGNIENVSMVLDPDNKTMKVRVNLTNVDHLLKPEMFANVIVRYRDRNPMLSVPSRALVFDKSRNFVMLFNTKSDVQTREVRVFSVVGEKAYISAGLRPGDRVITKCQLLIYNALNES
jgi:cobalt-zinc-cadmium efflux system membrane fusion protein